MNIDKLRSVANKNTLHPEHFLVYFWISSLTASTGSYRVDYKELGVLTGLALKNLSRALKMLEKLSLIGVERLKGKVTVYGVDIPESYENSYERKVAEYAAAQLVQKNQTPISAEAILKHSL